MHGQTFIFHVFFFLWLASLQWGAASSRYLERFWRLEHQKHCGTGYSRGKSDELRLNWTALTILRNFSLCATKVLLSLYVASPQAPLNSE